MEISARARRSMTQHQIQGRYVQTSKLKLSGDFMMDCAQCRLGRLNRPKILVKAAHIGLSTYNRNNTLRRVLQRENIPDPGAALDDLLQREDAVDTDRRAGVAAYSPARHIELLIALMTEARLADAIAT